MTDENPTPVDPARVLAALEVLGWPDDRADPATAPAPLDECDYPLGLHWKLAEDVIRAADAASSEQHVIEFRADGWTIQHPLSCRPNLFDCPVNRAAERGMAGLDGPPAPPGRYACALGSPEEPGGDWFYIGDRVDQDEVPTNG
ncbi:DUF6085 family protein [Micromonospora fulviviridis]|uniref:DUF6085 family protein n=1 Tax=Micromonospora fulviviridis TaxID=47860 RepID=UPI0037A32C4B